MAERLNARDAIDIPDKVAIYGGSLSLIVGMTVPGLQFLVPIGAEAIVAGGIGLGVTRGTLPRKK